MSEDDAHKLYLNDCIENKVRVAYNFLEWRVMGRPKGFYISSGYFVPYLLCGQKENAK